ncbi:EF-P lysine aminoacylase GenX [Patescibacteria group bacterium]|nr:MAG: EF-P lysine aminoacylase GenX [Patescibacteria group bacterium]
MRRVQDIASERQRLNDLIRSFFRSRGYAEVETPTLVASPDLAPNFTYFETTLVAPGEKPRQGALITSPEFSMKKLLGQGMEKIFTLARVFRNDEDLGGTPSTGSGQVHNPEFTMLEWYKQGADYHEMMDETEALVREACAAFSKPATSPLERGEPACRQAGMRGSAGAFRRLRVRDLLLDTAGVDLDTASAADLAEACDRLGLHRDAADTESDLFYRLFLAKAEPSIGTVPTFVYDYPLCQAALAAKTADGKYAQRVELYVDGVELANGFTELTDATEQRARFEAERAERVASGKSAFPVDEELLALLPSVRSPTYGNALGIDRLHMLCIGTKEIGDVLLFPASKLFKA